jgi:hypothetical protein
MPQMQIVSHMTDTRTIRTRNRTAQQGDVERDLDSAIANIGERLDVWAEFSAAQRLVRRREYAEWIVHAVLALTRRLS